MSTFLSKILKLLTYIFKLIAQEFSKLSFASRGGRSATDRIEPQDVITDIVEVFLPTRIFFIFNILAFIVFIILPQGKDVILIVIEDASRFHFGSLLSLLCGVAVWAVLAEFGARYKIYISDNSGKSLTANRVNFRKQLQKFFSMVYLLLPYLFVLLSAIIVTIRDADLFKLNWAVEWLLPLLIILLIITAAGVAIFYLDDGFNKKFKESEKWKWAARFFKLPANEENWANKLY